MTNAIRILGLDPGLRRTGWGVVSVDGSRLSHIAHGVICPDETLSLAERLVILLDGIEAVIAAHGPHEAAVEETFVNSNPSSTLKLGHARAAALIAPSRAGQEAVEARSILAGLAFDMQQQLVAHGRQARQGARTAAHQIADAADALAVAITHAHARRSPAVRRGAA